MPILLVIMEGETSYMVKRIEFMGLPGSGKTTLCNMVAREFKLDNFHMLFKNSLNNQYSEYGKLAYMRYLFINRLLRGSYIPLKDYNEQVSTFIVDNNNIWKDLMELTLLNDDALRRKYIIKNIMVTIAQWGIISKSHKEVRNLIMDEGLTNRFLTMNLPISNNEVNALINRIYTYFQFPDVVINLTCDVDSSIERMKKRKKGIPESFQMLSRPALESKLEKINEFSQQLITLLENGGAKVISIKNNDLQVTKQNIYRELNLYFDI